MSGHKQPPKSMQFQKGQSGNPKGRPKSRVSLPSHASKLVLEAGERKVTVRDGDEVREVSEFEAMLLALRNSGLKGNPIAQRTYLDLHVKALEAKQLDLEEDNQWWKDAVDRLRLLHAEAQRLGNPPPDILPHPDDIIIDPERGVRFIGPSTSAEAAMVANTQQWIDVLIMQHEFDSRHADTEDPDQKPGSAMLFAMFLNQRVPARLRLSDFEFDQKVFKCMSMNKRVMAKTLYRSWRALGRNPKRGQTWPPLKAGREFLELAVDAFNDAIAGAN